MALRTFRYLIFILFDGLAISAFCAGQQDRAVRFSPQNRVFRIDAGEATYAFGVNEKNELQSIYWGGRLRDDDTIPSPKTAHEVASFDSPSTTTLQEFSDWGGGIYVEPALKVTFSDGNRSGPPLCFTDNQQGRLRRSTQGYLSRHLRRAALHR